MGGGWGGGGGCVAVFNVVAVVAAVAVVAVVAVGVVVVVVVVVLAVVLPWVCNSMRGCAHSVCARLSLCTSLLAYLRTCSLASVHPGLLRETCPL